MSSLRSIVALATLLVACAAPAAAMTIVPLDLPELTGQAERIFVGRVERVDAGRDANGLPATWTTFSVEQQVKGAAAAHLTLKQLGTSIAPTGASTAPANGGVTTVLPHPGLPRYRPGESVLLFVHPESALGFTSPVGLGQGCFRVRDEHGTTVAANDVGNLNLAGPSSGVRTRATAAPSAARPGEPIPLDVLLERVRTLMGGTP